MTAYLGRRLLQSVAVVLLVTLIVFGLLRLAPGAAAADVLGTGSAHQQFLLQYLTWLGQILHGNLGYSRARNESVADLLATSLPRTLALTGISTLIALAVAVPLGLLQAVRRSRAADHLLRGLTYLFYGMPTFVLGAVLVLFFAVDHHVFGAEGPQAPGILGVITDVRDLTLPVLTLTLVTIAIFARYMRSSALDSLAEEYVEAARARGAGQRRVLTAHVLRNSLVPVVTLVGLSFPQIVGGAVVVESLFNIQGMGWQIWQAVLNHDFAVTLGFTLVIGVGAVIGSLLADIGYAVLDPRVRYVQA
ncbi:MAG TPA: ABC transporter permease [Streptosporangiaceae bacterium]|jgi:peptide/nickel transport system permease protein|nr:ABC transporter permease [Streptosporangiaceae bacterium]